MTAAAASLAGHVVDYDPTRPFVPLGLQLWVVMPGRARRENRNTQVTSGLDDGPVALVFQAESARQVFDMLANDPGARWLVGGVHNVDRWIANHVMPIDPKDGPSVLLGVRKDSE